MFSVVDLDFIVVCLSDCVVTCDGLVSLLFCVLCDLICDVIVASCVTSVCFHCDIIVAVVCDVIWFH